MVPLKSIGDTLRRPQSLTVLSDERLYAPVYRTEKNTHDQPEEGESHRAHAVYKAPAPILVAKIPRAHRTVAHFDGGELFSVVCHSGESGADGEICPHPPRKTGAPWRPTGLCVPVLGFRV